MGDSHDTGGTRQISNDSQKYPFVQQAKLFMKLLWSDIALVILTVESLWEEAAPTKLMDIRSRCFRASPWHLDKQEVKAVDLFYHLHFIIRIFSEYAGRN